MTKGNAPERSGAFRFRRVQVRGPGRTSLPVRSRQLAIGAALLGFSLASTQTRADPPAVMTHTTLDGVFGNISAGGPSVANGTLIYNNTSPTTYAFETSIPLAAGSGLGFHYATGYAPLVDRFLLSLSTSASMFAGGSGWIDVTFTSDVIFTDFGATVFGFGGGWTHASVPITDGDVFTAGSYRFDFSFSHAGAPQTSFGVGALFTAVPVPLPGAAGLAALGLLGLGRGRRR